MGQSIEYMRPDGNTAPAYLASADENAPGIVVVEEWWGITADIMRIADEYAANGYRALVPDLFRGRTAAVGDEANHLVEGLDFHDAFSQDVRGALAHLKKNGKKAGVTGYCMGGAIALLTAMHVKEADAAVCFYGIPPREAGDPATIEIPLQCHFGNQDEFFTAAQVSELEQRLKEGKVPYEFYRYDAKHGFCNPNQPGNSGLGNYNSEAAHTAWERTVKFWKNTLQG